MILSKKWDEKKIRELVGVYHKAFISYANDEKVRNNAASGGAVSSILLFCIKNKLIDGALVCKTNIVNGKVRTKFVIGEDSDTILEAQGSKYVNTNFIREAFHLIERYNGRLVIVGLPCEIDFIRKMMKKNESYNIIMQGDVTKVIEMSPTERRGIIDDISGISEFDEKREKAGRELEKVENRVRENMIVVVEKQRLVSRLKEEKENAEKYLRLEKDMRRAKASLIKNKLGARYALGGFAEWVQEVIFPADYQGRRFYLCRGRLQIRLYGASHDEPVYVPPEH